MKKILQLICTVILLSLSSFAANAAYQGACIDPGTFAVVSGLSSNPQNFMATHQNCRVTVNISGGGLATIFVDNSGTPLSNPFIANADGSFHFSVAAPLTVDVILDNNPGSPATVPLYSSPRTIAQISIGVGSGGGGGCSPGGSTNDVQINAGGGNCAGTGGKLQYIPLTQTTSITGAGGLNVTGPLNFGASSVTITNTLGTVAGLPLTACVSGQTAIATDAPNATGYYLCGLDGFFHALTAALPAAPGINGSLITNASGSFGFVSGMYYDSVAKLNHFPGGASFDSTLPFSIGGICATSSPLGASSLGQALIGWDIGCIPKISYNATGPFAIGLQSLIDYTYLKLDANNCFAIGPSTGDTGWARIGGGVMGLMNCASPTSPTKLNLYNTFTSTTNSEWVSLGFSQTFNAYILTADHGSLAGSYHPLYLGAAGTPNPFWAIQTVGPLTCLPTNPSCDFGSITTSQQIRNAWVAGFISENIIGPAIPVNASGVQVGLVASYTATNPAQVTTSTISQLNGTAGIVGYVSNGTIPLATIVNGGAGYVAPTCAVSNPPINSGVTATCTATQVAGVLTTVTITNAGANNGYQSIQSTTITITDTGGVGAVVIPVITAAAGFAGIAQNGSFFSPIFDGNVSTRNQLVGSGTNAGMLHDSGISCSSPRIVTQKVYGCSTATTAGAAGLSSPMLVGMTEATSVMLLGVTPSATSCPTGAGTASTCKDTITLSPAMPDTNYIAYCSVATITAGSPQAQAILTADKSAGSFKVQVINEGTIAAQVGTYDCEARHR